MIFGAANGVFLKGAGHKYIRRIPKAGGKGWRYFYTVTGGHGLGHHAEFVKDAAFKIRSREGQEGHVHILEDHGDEVTLKHDESGKTARISKAALAAMLEREHAQALGVVRERAAKNLEQARKTGTPKQQARLAEVVKKYAGAGANITPKPTEAAGPVNGARSSLAHGVEMAWHRLEGVTNLDDVAYERRKLRAKDAASEAQWLGSHSDAEVLAEVERRRTAQAIPGQSASGEVDPTSAAFQKHVVASAERTHLLNNLLGVSSGVPGQWTREPVFGGEYFKTRNLMREGNYLSDLFLASYAAQHGMVKPDAYITKDRSELRRWNGNGWDTYQLHSGSEAARDKFAQDLRSQAMAWGRQRDLNLAMDNRYKAGLPNIGAWGRGTLGVDVGYLWALTQDPAKIGLVKTATLGPEAKVDAAGAHSGPVGDAKLMMPKVGASMSDWGRRDLQPAPTPSAAPAPKIQPAEAPNRYGIAPPSVLAQVNALPLPKAETRVGETWRERRHHMGDVSIAASGPYAVLHNTAHAQLERMWRAKRLDEAGFTGNHPNTWGQIKDDTARTGGAPETVPHGTKPAPYEPPSAPASTPAGVQGMIPGAVPLHRVEATAKRSKPKERINLPTPLVGPSGAKLLAYEWQHKLVDDVDKRGEDRVRRVSDWDKAAPSEHTGRDIVHHFEVAMPSGDVQTVSAESALDLLGYKSGPARGKIKGLADDLMEQAQAQTKLAELEDTRKRFEDARRAVEQDPSTPRSVGTPRMEGMWAVHNIGGKSYKTAATIWNRSDEFNRGDHIKYLLGRFMDDKEAEYNLFVRVSRHLRYLSIKRWG
jgi:hypothetical protein